MYRFPERRIPSILDADFLKGGQGSGNFGHAGRPGERGGSTTDGGSGGSKPSDRGSAGGKTPKEAIGGRLKTQFDDIAPKLKTEIREQYHNHAERVLSRWREYMANNQREPSAYHGHDYNLQQESRRFLDFSREQATAQGATQEQLFTMGTGASFQAMREFPSAWGVNEKAIDKLATEAVEDAQKGFVDKNLGKYENVLGSRNDIDSFDSSFRYNNGVFTGTGTIKLKNGDTIKSDLSLKYVVRTTPRVTPFYQYPLRFTSATIGGKQYNAPSEAELKEFLAKDK